MTINLVTKYADKLAPLYSKNSVLSGNTNKNYSFAGVKGIDVICPVYQELNDYTRSGTSRYGAPTEMQDTVQHFEMTQDKSFAITIDKGNLNEQLRLKKAGKMMNGQIKQKVVPYIDKYALKKWVKESGKIVGATKPTKNTIVGLIGDAGQYMDDNIVTGENRYIYLTAEMYNLLRQCPEFLAVDKLAEKALVKGQVGECMDFKIIKVPTSWLPADVWFLACQKDAVILADKLADAKHHMDPPGISGDLLEGRYMFDAFVLGSVCNGAYATALTANVLPVPTITITSNSAAITCTGSTSIKYTTDGTDPRYSKTALTYSSAVTLTSGQTIKAAGYADAKHTSGVATEVNS